MLAPGAVALNAYRFRGDYTALRCSALYFGFEVFIESNNPMRCCLSKALLASIFSSLYYVFRQTVSLYHPNHR